MSDTTSIHPETAVAFVSKAPHQTMGVTLYFPVQAEPTELIQALAAIGFVEDTRFNRMPAFDGEQELGLHKTGSGLFGGWTPEEKKANVAAARKVLRSYGFTGVPHHKLTLADLL